MTERTAPTRTLQLLERCRNLLINADDYLHLTYRIDSDDKRREIGSGIIMAMRQLRKDIEAVLPATDADYDWLHESDPLLAELKYIADSPLPEHGGFHPRVVAAAKGAVERLTRATDAGTEPRHLVHEARQMILKRWAKYSDPKNLEWNFDEVDKWERHAINAVLDLEMAEISGCVRTPAPPTGERSKGESNG